MQFQFHLVRLKERLFSYRLYFYAVSIPFSTIKRKLEKSFSVIGTSVSIPFSTIKSFILTKNQNRKISFQFHLVRLKGIIMYSFSQTAMFQFHLVRLKAKSQVEGLGFSHVSIPFSTIKSYRRFPQYVTSCGFNSI